MGRNAWGARPPSPAVYFVALGGIVVLLAMLCLYCLYFCFTRVKELSRQELVPYSQPRSSYPVQPGVREGAQAMAQLCRRLPTEARDADAASPSTHDTSVASHTTNDVSVSSQSHSTQDSSITSHAVHDAKAANSQTPAANQAAYCQVVSQAIDDAHAASPIRDASVTSPILDDKAALLTHDDAIVIRAVQNNNVATRVSLRNSFLFDTSEAQDRITSNSPIAAVCKSSHDATVASQAQQQNDMAVTSQPQDSASSPYQINDEYVTSQTSYDASASSHTLDDATSSYDLAASELTAPAVLATVNEIAAR